MKKKVICILALLLFSAPLQVQSSNWQVLGLTNLGGSLGWVIEVDQGSATGADETSLAQELKLNGQGYIFHPYLVDVSGSVQLASKTGSTNTFALDAGSLRVQLLKKKPFSLMVEGGEKQVQFDPLYARSYRLNQSYYEAILYCNSPSWPGRLRYYQSWAETIDAPRLFNTQEEQLAWETRHQFNRDIMGEVKYEGRNLTELETNLGQRRQDLRAAVSANFLYELIQVDGSYYWSNRTGSYFGETQQLTAKTTVKHSPNFVSRINGEQRWVQYHNGVTQEQVQGQGKTTWQLRPDLGVFVRGDVSQVQANQAIETQTLGAGWGVKAEKKLGETLITGGYELSGQKKEASGGLRLQTQEELVVTTGVTVLLSENPVDLSSIQVFISETGQACTAQDYRILVIGDQAYLLWLGPTSESGLAVVVEYVYFRATEAQNWSNLWALGLRRSFSPGWQVGGRAEYLTKTGEEPLNKLKLSGDISFTQGGFSSNLYYQGDEDDQHLTSRLSWQHDNFQATWQHQRLKGSEQVQITEERVGYAFSPWAKGRGQLGLLLLTTKGESKPEEQLFQTHLQFTQAFSNYFSGQIQAGYRVYPLQVLKEGLFVRYSLDYRRGQFSLGFKGDNDQRYRLGVTRYF